MSILLIVFLIAATSLMTVQSAWKRNTIHSKRLMNLLKIDKVVDSNFRNIIPFKWRDEETRKWKQVFSGEPDRIIFASIHRINDPNEGGIRFMEIFLADEKLTALYKKTPILSWDENTMEGNREVLAEDVQSIEFSYADLNREREVEWFDSWDQETEPSIPMAIQLKITWKDGTSDVWLRRTAGASKRSNIGRKIYPNRQ